MRTGAPLKIIHCFRSPVGGIFRHVRDLIDEQVAAGHAVGVICDSNTGGAFEESLFDALRPKLSLGLHRCPMNRAITPHDALVSIRLLKSMASIKPDVLHAHGAKGGAYARAIGTALRLGGHRVARLYCPHGGSIHFDPSKFSARVYFQLERLMERFTDRLIFVSRYERDAYLGKVGQPHCPTSLVRNGLRPEEFEPVQPNPDAADLLYVGMMRDLKGVDLFLNALPLVLRHRSEPLSVVLVGDGPDLQRYKSMAADLMVAHGDKLSITFHDPMPARQAFALGQHLVVPSRAESMPYIVLESLAASVPLLAPHVGGIPEIFGELSHHLIQPDDASALAIAMAAALKDGPSSTLAAALKQRVETHYSAPVMARDVMAAYLDALNQKTSETEAEHHGLRSKV